MILHLGIDIGTSGIKTVTIDQAGSTRSFFSVPYEAAPADGCRCGSVRRHELLDSSGSVRWHEWPDNSGTGRWHERPDSSGSDRWHERPDSSGSVRWQERSDSSGSVRWYKWPYIEGCIKRAVEGNAAMLASEGIDSRDAIKSIGISSVCPSVVGMNKLGDPTTDTILYNDTRSSDEELEIRNKIGDERFFEESKNRIFPGGVSATSILWLKNHCREEYDASDYIGHLSTLLGLSLTGKAAIDPSHASCTGLFRTASAENEWNYAFCNELGIDVAKLPRLVASNEAIGGLINHEYVELGLAEGIPVSVGGNDTSCAALAAGAVNDGDLFESCGSTDVLYYVHSNNHDAAFSPDFINRKHVVDGLWIANGALSSGGVSLKWFAENYFGDDDMIQNVDDIFRNEDDEIRNVDYSFRNADDSCRNSDDEIRNVDDMYGAVERSAMQSAPGANRMLFLPFMNAERAPFWWKEPKTGFFNGEQGCLCDMSRAVYESSGYGIRLIFDKLASVYDIPDGCGAYAGSADDATTDAAASDTFGASADSAADASVDSGTSANSASSAFATSGGQILAAGGGIRNLYQMQIKSDILQRDYRLYEVEFAAAKGAAILGGDAAGYIDSKSFVPKAVSGVIHHDPSLKAAYDEAYGEFIGLIR